MSPYRNLLASMPASVAEAIEAGRAFLDSAAEHGRIHGGRPPIQKGDTITFEGGASRVVDDVIPSDRGRTVTVTLRPETR